MHRDTRSIAVLLYLSVIFKPQIKILFTKLYTLLIALFLSWLSYLCFGRSGSDVSSVIFCAAEMEVLKAVPT